ncbi:hypothetical protein ABT282_08640 [Streptomyces sp. NPDC000927]|uniref:hypothetical protein n=1 Tax=Streptomyces sp. NPDC000927 TaxID=3154371 RepID=UPI00332CD0FA
MRNVAQDTPIIITTSTDAVRERHPGAVFVETVDAEERSLLANYLLSDGANAIEEVP